MSRIIFLLAFLGFMQTANAQTASTQDAQYIAITKAVVNYKINDEEISKDIEKLRQHKRFNEKLQRMMDKLTNGKFKNSKNKKVMKILEEAGKELEKVLD
jgi:uncharacterized membrane protein YheB (UPF0754 family)